MDAANSISCLDKVISLFDTIADRFDVFKVEIRTDASYMVVAGIHDQTHIAQARYNTHMVRRSF